MNILQRAKAAINRRRGIEHGVKLSGRTLTLRDPAINRIANGGGRISLYGWTRGKKPMTGDYLIIEQRGKASTRYLAVTHSHPGNPHDQWFCDAIFAPRPAGLPSSERGKE